VPAAATPAKIPIESSTATADAFLGGRVEAIQPAAGHHRAGLEAVLLAASVPEGTNGTVVDLGAGAGVAGLCVAARCPEASVVLVERDTTLANCARAALARPANRRFVARVVIVETDIANRAGLSDGMAAAVVCNPPFYQAREASASPSPSRADAHVLGETGLDPWLRAAAALVRPGGTATVVFRADGLDLVIEAASGRFGALDILPIAPRPGMAAHRILVRGVKASRAPLRLLPQLVLHNDDGNGFRPEVDAILRQGAELSKVVPSWNNDHGRTS
jgi:tRNA1(Val) A37 N6-methylase TrmN6